MTCINFKYYLNFISATMLSQYFHYFSSIFHSNRVIILEIIGIPLNTFLLHLRAPWFVCKNLYSHCFSLNHYEDSLCYILVYILWLYLQSLMCFCLGFLDRFIWPQCIGRLEGFGGWFCYYSSVSTHVLSQ